MSDGDNVTSLVMDHSAHSDTAVPQTNVAGSANIVSDSGHSSHLHYAPNVTLVFASWTTTSWATLVVACFGIAAISAFYEFLQLAIGRLQLATTIQEQTNYGSSVKSDATMTSSSTASTLASQPEQRLFLLTRRQCWMLLLRTLLHLARVGIGYALMLAVMSFNSAVYLAVLLGASLGYLAAAYTDLRYQATVAMTSTYTATTLMSGIEMTSNGNGDRRQPLQTTYQSCH